MALTFFLGISLLGIYFFSDWIRKNALLCYLVAMVFAFEGLFREVLSFYDYEIDYPSLLEWVMEALDKGIISTALFIWVMFGGALNARSTLRKKILICRGEVSIMASYLIMPHLFTYTYEFLVGFSRLSRISGMVLWGVLVGFIAGMVAGLIMLPLFVTSYRNIRKKMGGKRWKALQEYAYLFYGLVYFHIVFEWLAKSSEERSLYSLGLYTIVFLSYLSLKLLKVIKQSRRRKTLGGVV